MERIIVKVRVIKRSNKGKGQKIVTIPFKSSVKVGDYVEIMPLDERGQRITKEVYYD